MIVVAFYVELASDEQWLDVERALRMQGPRFITGPKLEGITLEEVEERVKQMGEGLKRAFAGAKATRKPKKEKYAEFWVTVTNPFIFKEGKCPLCAAALTASVEHHCKDGVTINA